MFEYSDFDDFIEFPVKYKTTINGFNFSTLPPRTLMEHIKERLMRGSRTYAYGHPHNFTAVFLGTEFDETLQNGIESDDSVVAMSDPEYEQFLADIWVGIVLTLMVLSCVCCMCSCLLYHKFQQWKRHVLEGRARSANNVESGGDTESLPSYTIVSGLPSYEEALEQLKQVKTMTGDNRNTKPSNDQNAPSTLPTVTENVAAPVHDSSTWQPHTPPTPNGGIARLSVADLFQIYRHQSTTTATQISPTISSNIETSNKC